MTKEHRKPSVAGFKKMVTRHLSSNHTIVTGSLLISDFDAIGVWQEPSASTLDLRLEERNLYRWKESWLYFYRLPYSALYCAIYFHGWEKGFTVYAVRQTPWAQPGGEHNLRIIRAGNYQELRKVMMTLDRNYKKGPLYGDGSRFYQILILSTAVCLGFAHVGYAADRLLLNIYRGQFFTHLSFNIVQSILVGLILIVVGFYYLQLSTKILWENMKIAGYGKEDFEVARNKKRKYVGYITFGFTLGHGLVFSLMHFHTTRILLIIREPFQALLVPLGLAIYSIVLIYRSIKFEQTHR